MSAVSASGGAAWVSDTSAGAQPDLAQLIQRFRDRGLSLATGESLTAGSLAARIAEVPGASVMLRGGVIAYCNAVKHSLLGVDETLLERRGAVDPAVAASMARGAAARTESTLGISTTGVAGPEPHEGRDVGTVYVGLACRNADAARLGLTLPPECRPDTDRNSTSDVADSADSADSAGQWISGAQLLILDGERSAIRDATVLAALMLLARLLNTEPPGLTESR